MTAAISAVPNGDAHLDPCADLLAAISTSPHSFLQPTAALHTAAILAAKQLLDPLAAEIAELQGKRRDENRKKRKRNEYEPPLSVLQLRQVHTAGFGVSQIWEQSRRILDAAGEEVRRDLEGADDGEVDDEPLRQGTGDGVRESEDPETASAAEEGFHSGSDYAKFDEDQVDFEDEVDLEADEEIDNGEDDIEALTGESASDLDQNPSTFVQDPNGLNDGFFSIDDFNKQSQFLEQHDANGEDDNPSDEDEVDWDANPLAVPLNNSKHHSRLGDADNDKDESDEEVGPTFGNADLDVAESDEDGMIEDGDLEDAMPGLANTNDVKYANFFEPPPKKPSKTKRMRALPKTQPPKADAESQDVGMDDVERAMADVRRGLFDSEEEVSDEESESGSDEGAPLSKKQEEKNLSTHEKQRAKIAAEIRRLEAANVSKRDWTLSGEARAADRPMNSLIEEDLEFERAGKPVPVITAEVSEEIEQLIKRRIIAREFDEVIRRRPDAIGSAAETRRGRVEVDDTKPQQGLADIYEQEHLKNTDPGYVDKRSVATKKQHAEIDRLWKDVSAQLDLLSNLHFKPKRVEAEIKTVEDKPVISMEDARPVGAGGEESRLAPQEIYRPGEDGKVRGEVVKKSGANVSKEELTREEKLRRRRREKERQKKATGSAKAEAAQRSGGQAGKGKKSKKAEQEGILEQLKKGGVKVIGERGEMEDLGKKKAHRGGESASALKL